MNASNRPEPKSSRETRNSRSATAMVDAAPWSSRLQRVMLGSMAGAMIVAGMLIRAITTMDPASQEYYSGTLLKVGMVLGIAWLAAPQLERMGWERVRGSALVGIVVVLVLWAIRPKIGAWAGAILAIGACFFAIVGWLRNQITR